MRRVISVSVTVMVLGLAAADAQAGRRALCSLARTQAALRTEAGRQQALQSIGAQRVAAGLRHI